MPTITKPYEFTREWGADGSLTVYYKGQKCGSAPPLPADPAWRDRVARDMTRINIGILERIDGERKQSP